MIFVTVGTHEQQFNRLVSAADKLADKESVFIQSGYSDFDIKRADYERFISADKMKRLIETSEIVITHGGPGSIMAVLETGKVPVAVPRLARFKEHVNDHQLQFCKKLALEGKCILVTEVEKLPEAIDEARKISRDLSAEIKENRSRFVENLKTKVNQMWTGN